MVFVRVFEEMFANYTVVGVGMDIGMRKKVVLHVKSIAVIVQEIIVVMDYVR